MVNGIRTRIAFKAVNSNGLGAEINGIITDEQNNEVAAITATHLGMGSFAFTPEAGKNYTARLNTGTVPLPKATDDGYVLVYTNDYLKQSYSKAVSFTLPKRKEPYISKTLFAFFDGLIPEGWLLDIAVDYWKLKPNDRFQLLLATCRDTIGAVTILPGIEIE